LLGIRLWIIFISWHIILSDRDLMRQQRQTFLVGLKVRVYFSALETLLI
jgi:hypothetical protein